MQQKCVSIIWVIPGALTRTTFVSGVAGLTSPGDAMDVVGEAIRIMVGVLVALIGEGI